MLVPGPKLAGVIVAAPAFLFVNILCSPTVVPSATVIVIGVAEFARINPLEVSAAPVDVISPTEYAPFSIVTDPVPLPAKFKLKLGSEP